MNLIAYLMESRGIMNSAQRLPKIAVRFGISAGRMERALNGYIDTAARYGGTPTLAVTANLLERYPRIFMRVANRGAELAIHGYVHTDYSLLGYDEQHEHIEQGLAMFRALGIPVSGIRHPYVRWNRDSIRVAKDLGLEYSSNRTIAWDVVPRFTPSTAVEAYRNGLRLYRSDDAANVPALPSHVHDILDLPASLPDDEALVDRLRLPRHQRKEVWLDVFRRVYELGEMQVIILHHERFRLCRKALEGVLEEARAQDPPVWIASMSQIAQWWRRRAKNRLHIQRLDDGHARIAAPYDRDITVVTRGVEGYGVRPWYGRDSIMDTGELSLACEKLPIIGITNNASAALERFLEDEGYVVRRGVVDDCAIVLDGWQEFKQTDKREVLRVIDESRAPIVRVWRWPRGTRAAISLTGDVDSMTLLDFLRRPLEV
ncbi:MAG: polysaccharide deacetylase family protein [Dehalococcoidia bacterium]